jgi:hypothetical protein
MGQMGNAFSISVEKPEGTRAFRSLGVDGRIILEWTLD